MVASMGALGVYFCQAAPIHRASFRPLPSYTPPLPKGRAMGQYFATMSLSWEKSPVASTTPFEAT